MNKNKILGNICLNLIQVIYLSNFAYADPAPSQTTAELPLAELKIFADIFARIKEDYVEEISDQDLLEDAIRGMLSGLDPHSAYLDDDDYHDLKVGTSGEFGGLGIEVGLADGLIKVIAPIDDTPAQHAGLQAGDLIVRIDEHPVKGLSLNDATRLMRGKPGTKVKLTILREKEPAPFDVTLERAVIQVASVKSHTLEPGYGYVRLTQFQDHTTQDMVKAITEIKQLNEGKLKGLILDLRNNPGGVLNIAVGVSDAFLTDGLIVYTKGRIKDSQAEFRAGPDDVLDGIPLIVLVNGGSASASEIVAGALQDHKRALIVGTPTFGKGSVQTVISIDDNRALKLTTARYYTPSGRSIQAQGIIPDIQLAQGEFKSNTDQDNNNLKESDLAHHLSESDDQDQVDEETKTGKSLLITEDFQLAEALNILKGLVILGHTVSAENSKSMQVTH